MQDETSIVPFEGQDYETLKSDHDENNLFVDYTFPKNTHSYNYQWKRPKEVMSAPQFNVEGFHRADLDQGGIGNCWFIAACAAIMKNQNLFEKVCPKDQSFDYNYAGIFHFRFWIYGQWTDVVVDDRIPFGLYKNKPYFCKNNEQPNELWASLLEKAYAKVYGSYENLNGGYTNDALIDLSGGIQESLSNEQYYYNKEELWNILKKMWKNESLLGASIYAKTNTVENRLDNGLVEGHAYSITKIAVVNTDYYKNLKLIRIRNPWGNHYEWNGAWSDRSKEWNHLSASVKEKLNLKKEFDGEFWMNFDDYVANFESSDIVHLSVNSYNKEVYENKKVLDHEWNCKTYHSEWVFGYTAGGCSEYSLEKYWTNPQFLVELEDHGHYEDNKTSVLVALMQKDHREKGEREDILMFDLYKTKDHVHVNNTRNMRLYASQLEKKGSAPTGVGREVTKRFTVEPGFYVVIPYTYEPNKQHKFLLRLFTEQAIETDINPLDEHKEHLEAEDIFFATGDDDLMSDLIGTINDRCYIR